MDKKMNQLSFVVDRPSMEQYILLRERIGWSLPERQVSTSDAMTSLLASPVCAVAYRGSDPVGLCRVVGDQQMFAYLEDVLVLPELQGRGVGKGLVRAVLGTGGWRPGCVLKVCPSQTSVGFYESVGFSQTIDHRPFLRYNWGNLK